VKFSKQFFQESSDESKKDYTIHFGSKGYVTEGVQASQKFKSILEYHYKLKFEKIDFSQEEKAANTINSWVKDVTRGKVANLVTPDSMSNAIMILINAVYFRGVWELPFNSTIENDFYLAPNNTQKKTFMEQTDNFSYSFSAARKLRMLRLPYQGKRFSMFVILPFEKDGLADIIELLSDSELVTTMQGEMYETNVHVVLPKFKFDSSMKLKSILKEVSQDLCN
jgi:serine protease inhibitor